MAGQMYPAPERQHGATRGAVLAEASMRPKLGLVWSFTMLLPSIMIVYLGINSQPSRFNQSRRDRFNSLDSIPLDKEQPPPYTRPRSVHAIQRARLNSGTKVGLIWRSVRCKVPDPRD